MNKGYKYAIETCPECGQQVPWNWMIRHLKSECQTPQVKLYEVVDDLQPCGHPMSSIIGNGTTFWCRECEADGQG